MLLGVAACSSMGVPGANADLTPPAFAERPPPAVPPTMAAGAPPPAAPAPAVAATEPGAPVALTPAPDASPSAELSIPSRPAPLPPARAAGAQLPPPPPEIASPPPPVAAAAPPPATPASVLAFPFSWPFFVSGGFVPGQLPGPRLTLSNFSYDRARVEAAVTASSDCGADVVSRVEFDLAYNGTRVIQPPAGDDVCWRRDTAADRAGVPQWSRWNRAFLSAGQSVDSRL
jgi:hypothetical protein